MNRSAVQRSRRIPPCVISRFAHAFMFSRFSGRTPMAILTAFLDASGNKDLQVLTVAGFVSTSRRWDRFEVKWQRVLDRYGVTSMHFTDFAASKGEFRNWRGQSERRLSFVSELVECIRQETKLGFASSLVIADYNEVNEQFNLRKAIGSPYTLCGAACLGELQKWALKRKCKLADIFVAVEEGDLDQHEFLVRARRVGFKAGAQPKSEARAFQAGDMAGWKSRIMLTEALKESVTTIEQLNTIARSLDPIRPVVQRNGGWNRDNLFSLCIQSKIPLRPAQKCDITVPR